MGYWRKIAALLAVILPLLALCALGAVWLTQNDHWLPYLAGCVALTAVAALLAWASKWRSSGAVSPDTSIASREYVAPDNAWNEAETTAFKQSCSRIQEATKVPVAVEELRVLIEREMGQISRDLNGPNADAWDFSVPEGLLLTSRITGEFRGHVMDHVPFSNRLTVRQLRMGWSYSGLAADYWRWGKRAYRGSRVLINPVGGILAELRDVFGGALVSELGSAGIASLQALLLEEVSRNAVDLYSGRLRQTDAELADRAARSAAKRGDIDSPVLNPPAIVVMGQVSSGKTALINALLGETVGLSGTEPITDNFLSHNWDLHGMSCQLIDTPGLGQSEKTDAELADWVAKADMLLWVVAANRPARAPDHAFLQGISASFSESPELVPPPIIFAATHVDRLVENGIWPFPEHALPNKFIETLERLKAQVAADLKSTGSFVPVVVSDAPGAEWNIDELTDQIYAYIDAAAQTQRNRARFAKDSMGRAISQDVARFMRLTAQGGKMATAPSLKRVWQRLWQRAG